MRAAHDPITAIDILAYVDGQLDGPRRVEVERHLSRHPETAADVMADLSTRGQLRLALTELAMPGEPETRSMALDLGRRLKRRIAVRRLMQAAAVILVVGAGLLAEDRLHLFGVSRSIASTPPPTFVADALESFRTTSLRNAMASQTEVKRYDREELRAATAIVLPKLPDAWRIDDVQVFPSTFGPSVNVSLETADLGRTALYAARPGDDRRLPVTTAVEGGATAAFWQDGEVAYALFATGVDRSRLEREADLIRQSMPR